MAPREELAHNGDTFETFLGNGSVTNMEYVMEQARKLLFSLQWKYHDIREASWKNEGKLKITLRLGKEGILQRLQLEVGHTTTSGKVERFFANWGKSNTSMKGRFSQHNLSWINMKWYYHLKDRSCLKMLWKQCKKRNTTAEGRK